ncbi:unnamed protein product [Cercopithifilaria johnstoni]|uniref:Uncharacterized protein n=1 Tax=Cercopithifilaria johnstoni TaxID=2874296 RepID=A0A8J2M8A1_9BILA|nr:unnamed protein product [Cercopithifilaria johnstoni]
MLSVAETNAQLIDFFQPFSDITGNSFWSDIIEALTQFFKFPKLASPPPRTDVSSMFSVPGSGPAASRNDIIGLWDVFTGMGVRTTNFLPYYYYLING